MADLRAICERLRLMANRRPNPEQRAEVIAALSSKWEGVQASAVRVLGSWGNRDSVERLREFLIRCFDREAAWGIRGVIVQALRPIVTADDVGWVLDLYFSLPGVMPKHELLWLVTGLPPAAARERLVAALRDSRWENRQAAVKAIGNMEYPDRSQLLRTLHNDPDKQVRASAQRLAPLV